jgi:hypothetical protein
MFLVGKVPKINQMCFMIVKKNFMFGKLSSHVCYLFPNFVPFFLPFVASFQILYKL